MICATVLSVNVHALILTVTVPATVNLTPPVHYVSLDITQAKMHRLPAKNALLERIQGM